MSSSPQRSVDLAAAVGAATGLAEVELVRRAPPPRCRRVARGASGTPSRSRCSAGRTPWARRCRRSRRSAIPARCATRLAMSPTVMFWYVSVWRVRLSWCEGRSRARRSRPRRAEVGLDGGDLTLQEAHKPVPVGRSERDLDLLAHLERQRVDVLEAGVGDADHEGVRQRGGCPRRGPRGAWRRPPGRAPDRRASPRSRRWSRTGASAGHSSVRVGMERTAPRRSRIGSSMPLACAMRPPQRRVAVGREGDGRQAVAVAHDVGVDARRCRAWWGSCRAPDLAAVRRPRRCLAARRGLHLDQRDPRLGPDRDAVRTEHRELNRQGVADRVEGGGHRPSRNSIIGGRAVFVPVASDLVASIAAKSLSVIVRTSPFSSSDSSISRSSCSFCP